MVLSTAEEEFNPKRKGVFIRGQLKLEVYMNTGLLTVYVIKARHIGSKMSTLANSFALISLIPDETETCSCRTEVIPDSNNPAYDEKFSFELTDEHLQKRAMISICQEDPFTRLNEFLGCTSFGIARLRKTMTAVKGWYYLLNETVGRKKHLQITKREKLLATINRRASLPPLIPAINKDITGVEQLKLTVHRDRGGFGFTLVESCPVKVGIVYRDSHAAETGLREDDVIIQVNGVNVSRSTLTSVAKLLKNSGSEVSLDLIRHTSVFVESLLNKRRLKKYHYDEEELGHVSRPNAHLTKPLLRDSGYKSPHVVKFFTRFKSISRLSLNLF